MTLILHWDKHLLVLKQLSMMNYEIPNGSGGMKDVVGLFQP